jgi:hypothetical protein
MKANPKPGDVVEVLFQDHSEGNDVPLFRVFGRVIAKDRTKLVVCTWEGMDASDENAVAYTLLRKVIKEIYILKRHHESLASDCSGVDGSSAIQAQGTDQRRGRSANRGDHPVDSN